MGQKTLCDFPPAGALSQGRLRWLQTLHEAAADDFAAELSALLRSPVEVDLAGVDQLPYGKFIDGLESPAYFNLLGAGPLDDCLLLDVEPSILYPMIDRLLGGGREDEPPPHRPISDIELPLAARIVRLFLRRLCRAWRSVVELKLDVIQVESNPRLLRALHSDEMVASVDFQLTVGARLGTMRLCIPCRAIRRLDAKGPAEPGAIHPPAVRMSEEIAATEPNSTLEVSVALAATSIAADDLSSLQVGDIVATEMDASTPAVVSLAGEAKFLAKPGACRGRKAVCITGPVETSLAAPTPD